VDRLGETRTSHCVPGSVDFLRYAASVVYSLLITNRNQAEKAATAQNLKILGFPGVTDQTLLVRTDPATSSKEVRRKFRCSNFRVVLLMGDNLNDFSECSKRAGPFRIEFVLPENNRALFWHEIHRATKPNVWDWENANLRLQLQTY